MVAYFRAGYLDLRSHPEHGVFKTDFQIVADIFAALQRGCAACCPIVAEQIAEAEEVTQNVVQVETRGIEALACALHSLMAVPVIRGAFLRIAQNAVRLCRFLEPLLGLMVAGLTSGWCSRASFR